MKKINKWQTNNSEPRSTTKKYIERIIEAKEGGTRRLDGFGPIDS